MTDEEATSTSREEAPTGDDSARPGDATPETPFTDLDDYLALRRLGGACPLPGRDPARDHRGGADT